MQTDPIGYQDGMNWYTYARNDPVNGTDPTGMYGRGKGWSDEDWAAFDAAQKQAANEMSRAASAMRKEATHLKDGGKTEDGYSASQLNSMADSLDVAVDVLNDNGSGGSWADAVSYDQIGRAAVTNNVDPMRVAIDHAACGDEFYRKWTVGHEALHSAGLSDKDPTGTRELYKGVNGSKYAWKNLSISYRHKNSDHILNRVF